MALEQMKPSVNQLLSFRSNRPGPGTWSWPRARVVLNAEQRFDGVKVLQEPDQVAGTSLLGSGGLPTGTELTLEMSEIR
jgi:hypothetical protein